MSCRNNENVLESEMSAMEIPVMGRNKIKSSAVDVNRPQWGVHQSSSKYMSQTEKDPRFLQKRRERQRRRQRAKMEKQLHGSWPSSENSG